MAGMAAAALPFLRRAVKVARRAQRSREQAISAAVNISRDAARRGRGKMSVQERKKLRMVEVQRKMKVLKGRRPGPQRASEEASGEDETSAGEEEAEGGASARASTKLGEGQEDWAFRRKAPIRASVEESLVQVSDEVRAIAETELHGKGGVATSKQLVAAGLELKIAKDCDQAAGLLELVSSRISEEQLGRKLDYKLAQARDDEATEMLAEVYRDSGRLTVAFNTYDLLRLRVADPDTKKRAEVAWITVACRISESLQKAQRYGDCLALLESIREAAQTRVAGDKIKEEIEMTIAMCLHKEGKKDQAVEVLRKVRRNSSSRERKAQAQFIMDVMTTEVPEVRNEEFHKVWDDNFHLPKDLTASVNTGRKGSAAMNMNLSEQEREFKQWASKYWEERLKSPAYYVILTLWVTWPFAIPVVSLMRRAGMLEY